MDTRLGTELAGYRIERELGRGGMGVVYLAQDVGLHRPVALKVLAPELARSEGFRERFLRESELAAAIDHPNVIPIYAAGEAEGELFIAMRYVEGTDLRSLVSAQGALAPPRVGRIVAQVAAALDAAHARGLVHRDVKPGNVLLDSDDHAYLCDFGLTKQAGSISGLTATGQLVGTIDYVAPELIEGKPADGRADLYSLGCLLYECLAGQPPYRRDNDLATLWAHVQEPPPPLPPGLPAGLDPIIAKALAKDPDARYQSGRELAEAVAATVAEPGPVRPARPRRMRISRRATMAAGTLAAIAVGMAAFALTRNQGASTPTVTPNSVVLIDPGTRAIVADIPVGTDPASIAVGEGSVWVANTGDNTLSRIDPATRQVHTIGLGVTPTGVATGLGGVWVGDPYARRIIRIDPRGGPSTSIRLGPTPLGLITGPFMDLAVGDGSLWASDDGSHSVFRIDTEANSTDVLVRDANVSHAAFGEGQFWFTGSGPTLGRIDPATGAIKRASIGISVDIAAGAGAVWSANFGSDLVARIESDDLIVNRTIPVGDGPVALAVGFGSVWVANTNDGTVQRIDPLTNQVTDTIQVAPGLAGIAVGEGGVWVTVQGA